MGPVTGGPKTPVLFENERGKSAAWKNFAFEANEQGKPKDGANKVETSILSSDTLTFRMNSDSLIQNHLSIQLITDVIVAPVNVSH